MSETDDEARVARHIHDLLKETSMDAISQDKCYGRRLAKSGAARLVITRDTDRVPSQAERALFWRRRANEPGLGNVVFLRQPVPDCPQPESPFKPIEYITQTRNVAADATRPFPAGASPDLAPAGKSAAGYPFDDPRSAA